MAPRGRRSVEDAPKGRIPLPCLGIGDKMGGRIDAVRQKAEDLEMAVQLNHTIVWCRDKRKSSAFLTGILGLAAATPFAEFLVVELANGVSLDFHDDDGNIAMQHYAFLISEAEFDEVFERIGDRGLEYWADPGRRRAGEIYRHDGGRGLYFKDPDGHLLEVMTRPYSSES